MFLLLDWLSLELDVRMGKWRLLNWFDWLDDLFLVQTMLDIWWLIDLLRLSSHYFTVLFLDHYSLISRLWLLNMTDWLLLLLRLHMAYWFLLLLLDMTNRLLLLILKMSDWLLLLLLLYMSDWLLLLLLDMSDWLLLYMAIWIIPFMNYFIIWFYTFGYLLLLLNMTDRLLLLLDLFDWLLLDLIIRLLLLLFLFGDLFDRLLDNRLFLRLLSIVGLNRLSRLVSSILSFLNRWSKRLIFLVLLTLLASLLIETMIMMSFFFFYKNIITMHTVLFTLHWSLGPIIIGFLRLIVRLLWFVVLVVFGFHVDIIDIGWLSDQDQGLNDLAHLVQFILVYFDINAFIFETIHHPWVFLKLLI